MQEKLRLTQLLAAKAIDRLTTKVRTLPQWFVDRARSTYPAIDPGRTLKWQLSSLAQPVTEQQRIVDRAAQIVQHQFDLYGSGLRQSVPPGEPEVPRPCLIYSRAYLQKIQNPYQLLDWHRDLKSEHRWPPETWFMNVKKAGVPGDIRRPWELARFHHWHVLARAFGYTQDFRYGREIENQFYDFMASNPPRFGVNWASPMEVAIRAANWLLAVDLAQAFGFQFSREFLTDFTNAIWIHGKHVFTNLESTPSDRGNHFLANLCGLIFIASYMENSPEAEHWLESAVQQFNGEMEYQFLSDGGNFEGSTCYHRLCTEMLLYCVALLHGTNQQSLLREDWQRFLLKALKFSDGIEKPNGLSPQIGDNDSGRFLNVGGETESLDHRHLERAAQGLFTYPIPRESFERSVVRGLAQGKSYQLPTISVLKSQGTTPVAGLFDQRFPQVAATHRVEFQIPFQKPVALDTLQAMAWPDFGLYIIKGPEFYMSIRADLRQHRSMEGHAHNDLFSLDLQVHGRDLVRDPGTFVYTSDPETRNKYRSFSAHFPTHVFAGQLDENLPKFLFTFPQRLAGECLFFSSGGFLGRSRTVAGDFDFSFTVEAGKLRVRIISPKALSAQARQLPKLAFSPGYGQLGDAPALDENFIIASSSGM